MCKLQRPWKKGGDIPHRLTACVGAICLIATGCSSRQAGRTDKSAAVASIVKERDTGRREATDECRRAPVSEKQWVDRLAPRLSRSTQGLSFKRRADGITTVDLQGRFGHTTVARQKADGTVRYGCVDSPEAAQGWTGLRPVHGQAKQ
jgi:hypothetical protein